ncbi:MAG: hypothetical protein O9320_08720 [Magnetospirillum sp.]|nr:hypothetical protein [Magnetospirillum sp.]
MKVPPLHPLPGHKLHPIAKLSQRYRPTARGIEARVFEAKLVARLGSSNIDCIAASAVFRACKAFEIERFFGHARYYAPHNPANSVRAGAR